VSYIDQGNSGNGASFESPLSFVLGTCTRETEGTQQSHVAGDGNGGSERNLKWEGSEGKTSDVAGGVGGGKRRKGSANRSFGRSSSMFDQKLADGVITQAEYDQLVAGEQRAAEQHLALADGELDLDDAGGSLRRSPGRLRANALVSRKAPGVGDQNMGKLQKFLEEYSVSRAEAQVSEEHVLKSNQEKETERFYSELLDCMLTLAQDGFLSTSEEVWDLCSPLIALLDARVKPVAGEDAQQIGKKKKTPPTVDEQASSQMAAGKADHTRAGRPAAIKTGRESLNPMFSHSSEETGSPKSPSDGGGVIKGLARKGSMKATRLSLTKTLHHAKSFRNQHRDGLDSEKQHWDQVGGAEAEVENDMQHRAQLGKERYRVSAVNNTEVSPNEHSPTEQANATKIPLTGALKREDPGYFACG
jgi:hypothetical protein